MLDARGPAEWPCPCCGHRTLYWPGDYDLCPVCFWEDAGDQLRWPTSADGPNGISLIEAQRNFVEFGACDSGAVSKTREPQPGEEREAKWRVIDPELDDFERGPDDPGNLPWPEAYENLYWWRPTYFRRPENKRLGPAPRRAPSNVAEQMMARIIEAAPETGPIDLHIRRQWEEPAVMPFCGELVPFVIDAAKRGDTELALRIVDELNSGLVSGDSHASTCVSIGFLEPQYDWGESGDDWPPIETLGFRSDEMAEFVASWPKEIKAELQRQMAYQEKARRQDERLWGPRQPDGSWKVNYRWKFRHPILWWKMRHGGVRIAG
jgi:hypothetical protein